MIFIHVDVDNLWMYEKEFGIKIHPDRQLIYSQSLPILLKLLKKSHSKATFMIIGQDLLLPKCRKFCKIAIREGHEIANHTWSHPLSFNKMDSQQKRNQILRTHREIKKVCKISPVGFRGPGYYLDEETISILQELNYKYDSTILPGFAQLMMGIYSHLQGGKIHQKVFGTIQDIFSSRIPYHIRSQSFIEFPISVFPIIRLPIHTTFAYYFGEWYQNIILNYIKSKPKYLLYLFHAIDFVDLETPKNNHPIIPLRYSFNSRLEFAQKVIEALVEANREGLKPSRDSS